MERKKSAKRTKTKQGAGREEIVNAETKRTDITDVLEIVFIRNRVVNRALQVFPWLSIFLLVVGLLFSGNTSIPDKVMYYSGLLFVIVGLFIFQVLEKQVPLVFGSIWKRNIVELTDIPQPGEINTSMPSSKATELQISHNLEIRYQEYLKRFEDLLNHPVQWLMGGIFAAMIFVWKPFIFHIFVSDFQLLQSNTLSGIVGLIMDVMEFVWAYFMGLLIWRMIVIGVYVWKLGKTFKINPQIGHPDSCGGLEQIGNLCLWNILLIGLPSIYLGGWLLPYQIYKNFYVGIIPINGWILQSRYFKDLYPQLLLIPIAVSVFCFFIPLWSVHKSMLQGQTQVKKEMDDLAHSIAEIEKTLLNQAETLEQKKADELLKRLKTMQEVYERNKNYPTWPFNLRGLTKFFSVQLLPLLVSLGLMDQFIDWIKRLLRIGGS